MQDDPFAFLDDPSYQSFDWAPVSRDMRESGAVSFHCIACPEIVTIGDYDDPAHYAHWLRLQVEEGGWIETAHGLVCQKCFSDIDPPTKGSDS